jgi:hypothetical protein
LLRMGRQWNLTMELIGGIGERLGSAEESWVRLDELRILQSLPGRGEVGRMWHLGKRGISQMVGIR